MFSRRGTVDFPRGFCFEPGKNLVVEMTCHSLLTKRFPLVAPFLICGSVKCMDVQFESGLVIVGELDIDFVASLEQTYTSYEWTHIICEEWNYSWLLLWNQHRCNSLFFGQHVWIQNEQCKLPTTFIQPSNREMLTTLTLAEVLIVMLKMQHIKSPFGHCLQDKLSW
ncbi:uncharacterized protein LOC144666455 [Oculina patagonica]